MPSLKTAMNQSCGIYYHSLFAEKFNFEIIQRENSGVL
jgi:hypothetical protein